MIKTRLAAAAAALLFSTSIVAPAQAATINYTISGNFVGTLDGNAFDIAASFTGTGDTDDVTNNGFSNLVALNALNADAGGTIYNILTPATFYINAVGYVGYDFGAGGYFSGNNASLVGYDATSDRASTSIDLFSGGQTGATFLTDRGSVTLTGARNGTFSAAVAAVPEPATWAMMFVGFGMMGASMRYRRRETKVAYA